MHCFPWISFVPGFVALIAGSVTIIYGLKASGDNGKWAGYAFAMAGFFGLGWAIVYLVQVGWKASRKGKKVEFILNYMRTLLAGLLLGVVLTLLVAGKL